MATDQLEQLRAEALRLPLQERAQLAHELVRSLDAPEDSDVAGAWEAEISRRIAQIDAGTASLIDRDEFRRRLENRLARQ